MTCTYPSSSSSLSLLSLSSSDASSSSSSSATLTKYNVVDSWCCYRSILEWEHIFSSRYPCGRGEATVRLPIRPAGTPIPSSSVASKFCPAAGVSATGGSIGLQCKVFYPWTSKSSFLVRQSHPSFDVKVSFIGRQSHPSLNVKVILPWTSKSSFLERQPRPFSKLTKLRLMSIKCPGLNID